MAFPAPKFSKLQAEWLREAKALFHSVSNPNFKEGILIGPICVHGPFLDQLFTCSVQDQAVEM